MLIRPATLEDVSTLIAIAEQCATAAHWTEQQYRAAMTETHPSRLVLVLEDGGVLGFAVAVEVEREWELENIAIAPGAQRRGLGDHLLGALLNELKERGARSIYLEVRASNSPARALYAKWGFAAVGTRPGYYHNPPEEAILYKKVMEESALEIG